MLWVIICIDKPGSQALRGEHLEAHRRYLVAHADKIFFSGPQLSDDGSTYVGSVWIVKAESREEASAFVESEDLYRAGVFETVIIRRIRRGRLNPQLAE